MIHFIKSIYECPGGIKIKTNIIKTAKIVKIKIVGMWVYNIINCEENFDFDGPKLTIWVIYSLGYYSIYYGFIWDKLGYYETVYIYIMVL